MRYGLYHNILQYHQSLGARQLHQRTPDAQRREAFPWPSPGRHTDSWMAELAEAVQAHPNSGANSVNVLSPMFENELKTPDTIISKILGDETSNADQERILFKNLKTFPQLHQSLPSINSARAFK